MSGTRIKILLIGIILIASVLRLWRLGDVPISPDWDEVALAYEAHSLSTTGKDVYGEFLPVVLRSYDDYKPALYAYLVIPSISTFGMNSQAVRLPSAVFGILTVMAFYFLAKELFKRVDIALLSTFWLAISPWHIQFSRVAFESNLGLAFNVFTVLFFIQGLKKPWLLVLSAVFAGLNLSVYQSERVFTPLLVLALVIIYRKELFRIKKKYLSAALTVGILSVLPLIIFTASNSEALTRIRATSMFSNQTEVLEKTIPRLESDKNRGDFLGLIFDNRRVTYTRLIIGSYLVHFDPNWLFIKGDINRHHAPGMGLLYFMAIPFILIGIYCLIFGKFDRKSKYLLFSWFLLSPIPASVTFEVPHAVRTLNVVPVYQIFTSLGVLAFFDYMNSKIDILSKNNFIKRGIYLVFAVFASFNLIYYLNQYFVQQNYFYAPDWQYGYKEAVSEAEKVKDEYHKIIVSDKQPMDKSYMFFLFYLDYPPVEFQKTKVGNLGGTNHFEKYEFRAFDWEHEKINIEYIFIGSSRDFPDNIKARKIIKFPDKSPAILLVDPKDNI